MFYYCSVQYSIIQLLSHGSIFTHSKLFTMPNLSFKNYEFENQSSDLICDDSLMWLFILREYSFPSNDVIINIHAQNTWVPVVSLFMKTTWPFIMTIFKYTAQLKQFTSEHFCTSFHYCTKYLRQVTFEEKEAQSPTLTRLAVLRAHDRKTKVHSEAGCFRH